MKQEKFIREDSALSAEIGDEVVILNATEGVYYSLNETGNRIWEVLEDPVTVDEIIRKLDVEYELPEEGVHEVVSNLLEGLEECGLVARLESA